MERLDIVKFFAYTRELYRLAGYREDCQRSAAPGVAVKLGEDNAGDIQRLVEALRNIHGVLTCHGVHHQQYLVRRGLALDVFQLVHERFVNVQTSRSIQQNNVEAVVLGVFYALFCDLHRVGLTHLENVSACLFADYLQLVDSRRSVYITGNQQRTPVLRDKVLCKLCAVGGLTGTLQTAHHDNARRL